MTAMNLDKRHTRKREGSPEHAEGSRIVNVIDSLKHLTESLFDHVSFALAVFAVIAGLVLLALGEFPTASGPDAAPTEIEAIP